jgi:membrane-associated phospholipid phosphatase
MLAYTACIWFAIVYLGEHWVVDIIGGVIYAFAAYFAITHGPSWARRLHGAGRRRGDRGRGRGRGRRRRRGAARLGRRVRWALVARAWRPRGRGAPAWPTA